MAREFPTKFYDIVEGYRNGTSKFSGDVIPRDFKDRPEEESAFCRKTYERTRIEQIQRSWDTVHAAKLLFAPEDLAERIMGSRPSFVTSDMVRVPADNLFIEFGSPVTETFGSTEFNVYGVHVYTIEAKASMDFQSLSEVKLATFVIFAWYSRLRKKDDGQWHTMTNAYPVGDAFGRIEVGEESLAVGGKKIRSGQFDEALKHFAFLMFLNSSNVSYEKKSAPKMQRPRDRAWWNEKYEREFEVLQVKAVSKRIKLALQRSEAGFVQRTPHWVKAHFKVLTYCGSCGRRKGIRRFLFGETCVCKEALRPETAKTQMFWWDGHWTNDIALQAVAQG